jgi:sugar lactone lactonase YvrE
MQKNRFRIALGLTALLASSFAFGQSELYVTGFTRNKVFAFDAATGVATRTIGSAAVGLNGPLGVAIDTQGRIYVANKTSGRILRFILATGAIDNSFNVACAGCTDILIGPDGNVWALTGNQVRRFTPAGLDLGNYLVGGTLKEAYEMEIGPDGKLYICDWAPNHTTERNVKRYLASGSFERVFIANGGTPQLRRPNGIVWDASSNVYVSDAENNRIVRFNSTGSYLSIYATTGAGTAPSRLKFGPDGNLYVNCSGTGNVKRYRGPAGPNPGSWISDFVQPIGLEGGSSDYLLFGAGTAAGAIDSVDIVPSTVTGGFIHTTGFVTLSQKAPSGGTVVTLTSSDTNAATVPTNVTVAAGKRTAKFLITSRRVATTKQVTISARVGNQTKDNTLTVLPLMKSLTLVKSTVKSGDNLFGIVEFNTPATSATTVTIQTSNSNVAQLVSTNVVVPAGSNSAVFEINARTVSSVSTATITVTESGTSYQVVVTVQP